MRIRNTAADLIQFQSSSKFLLIHQLFSLPQLGLVAVGMVGWYAVVLLLQISEESTDSVHSVHTLFVYNCTQYSTVCVNNNKLVHTQACSTYSALPNSGILCLLLVHHNKSIM